GGRLIPHCHGPDLAHHEEHERHSGAVDDGSEQPNGWRCECAATEGQRCCIPHGGEWDAVARTMQASASGLDTSRSALLAPAVPDVSRPRRMRARIGAHGCLAETREVMLPTATVHLAAR